MNAVIASNGGASVPVLASTAAATMTVSSSFGLFMDANKRNFPFLLVELEKSSREDNYATKKKKRCISYFLFIYVDQKLS